MSINNELNQGQVFYNLLEEDVSKNCIPNFSLKNVEQLNEPELRTFCAFMNVLPNYAKLTATFGTDTYVGSQFTIPNLGESEYQVGGAELYAKLTAPTREKENVQEEDLEIWTQVQDYVLNIFTDNTQSEKALLNKNELNEFLLDKVEDTIHFIELKKKHAQNTTDETNPKEEFSEFSSASSDADAVRPFNFTGYVDPYGNALFEPLLCPARSSSPDYADDSTFSDPLLLSTESESNGDAESSSPLYSKETSDSSSSPISSDADDESHFDIIDMR